MWGVIGTLYGNEELCGLWGRGRMGLEWKVKIYAQYYLDLYTVRDMAGLARYQGTARCFNRVLSAVGKITRLARISLLN